MMRWPRLSMLVVIGLLVTGCSNVFGDLFDGYGLRRCDGKGEGACIDTSKPSSRPRAVKMDAGGSVGAPPRGTIFRDAGLVDAGRDAGVGRVDEMGTHVDSGMHHQPVMHHDSGMHHDDSGMHHTVKDASTPDPSSRPTILDSSSDGHDGGSAAEGGPSYGPPSCAHMAHTCGLAGSDDCCASILVPGGPFQLGYDQADSISNPAHAIVLTPYYLDQYEVTLGRFRQFVDHYDAWTKPLPGDGAYPGRPLKSGWQKEWAAVLPKSSDELKANVYCTVAGDPVWTDVPLRNETRAMNCLDWFTAYAFCIWDGGRLPTEAEWEFAAAGPQKRQYPWGDIWDSTYLNYANENHVADVGTAGNGNGVGPFGHSDLAGNVWEWTRDLADYYSPATDPPVDPLNPFDGSSGNYPISRGGSWYWRDTQDQFTTYYRFVWYPAEHNVSFGARCARDVPKGPPLGDAAAAAAP